MSTMPKAKKISMLLPNLRGGGAERVNLDLAYEFARKGHQVEFILMEAVGEYLVEAQAAFSIVDLNCDRARNLPLKLLRYLRRERPDALLVSMWPLTVIAPLMRLAGYRGRIVISEHAVLSVQYSSWGRFHRLVLRGSMAASYRLAQACVGVSAGVIADLALLSGIARGKFDVIHNPVPEGRTPSADMLKQVDAQWDAPRGARILTVGSMKPVKNHALLLQAFAQIADPDAKLMFVGTGALEAELRKLAKKLNVEARVTFAGFQSDPTPFYQTADVFVLSSNNEGFGNVIVESLACGTPVVSTNCPVGPREILENGKYGSLVPVGEPSKLAVAIQKSLNSTHDTNLLKQRAQNFSPVTAAQRYLELLRI